MKTTCYTHNVRNQYWLYLYATTETFTSDIKKYCVFECHFCVLLKKIVKKIKVEVEITTINFHKISSRIDHYIKKKKYKWKKVITEVYCPFSHLKPQSNVACFVDFRIKNSICFTKHEISIHNIQAKSTTVMSAHICNI